MKERFSRTPRHAAQVVWPERIVRACIWLAIFLMPTFFLPVTTDLLDLNKAFVLYLLVLVATISWLLGLLLKGNARWKRTPLDLPLILFLIFQIAAAVFSHYRYRSALGTSGHVEESLATVIGLALFAMLMVQTVTKEQLRSFAWAFLTSGAIVVVFNFLQVFSLFTLPWDVTHVVTFSLATNAPLGFTVYLSLIAPFAFLASLRCRQGILRIALAFEAVLAVFLLFVYDQPIGWYTTILAAVLILGYLNAASGKIRASWLLIPTLTIAVAVLGLFLNTQTLLRANIPGDVALPLQHGAKVTLQSLTHQPFVGNGQGTFDSVFSMYRPIGFNATALWGLRFVRSTNVWFHLTSTTGILATLALAALTLLVLWRLFRILQRTSFDDGWWWYHCAMFIAGCVLVFTTLVAPINLLLSFFLWMIFGLTFISEKNSDASSVAPRPRAQSNGSLAASLGFAGVTILALIFVYFFSRLWIADMHMARAATMITQQKKLPDIQTQITDVISLTPREQLPYFSLAENLLVQAQIGAQAKNADTAALAKLLAASAAAAKTGAEQYPSFAGSYEAQAKALQNIDNLIGKPSDQTRDAWQQAIKEDPNNPQLVMNLGQYYLALARTQTEADKPGILSDDGKKSLDLAQQSFQKATTLKADYLEPQLNSALVLRLQGKPQEAVALLEKLAQKNPNSTDALFNLSENYLADNRQDDALPVLQRLVALYPGYSDAHLRLAQVYETKKQTANAINEYAIVLRLNPNNTDIKKKLDTLKAAK